MTSWRERLPSQTGIDCKGCYAPSQSLTTKQHFGAVWHKTEIVLSEWFDQDKKSQVFGAELPCKFCGETRRIQLGEFSLSSVKSNLAEYNLFGLTKECDCPIEDFYPRCGNHSHRYNVLVALESNERLPFQNFHGFTNKGGDDS